MSEDTFGKKSEPSIAGVSGPDSNSVYPSKGYFIQDAASYITLGDKLTPIFKAQENINRITLDVSTSGYFKNDALTPILNFTGALNTSVNQLSKISLSGGISLNPLSYNFIKDPLVSSANVVADNIISLQKGYLDNLDLSGAGSLKIGKSSDYSGPSMFNVDSASAIALSNASGYTGMCMPELKLNSFALDALQSSRAFTGTEYLLRTEDKTTEKIRLLEEDVKKIKESDNKIIVSQISEKLGLLLEGLDVDLAKMFRGAVAVINKPNDDSLAQSAESMTRLLEKLPALLSPQFMPKNKKREDDIKEMLAIYLNIKYVSVSDIKNDLVDQQHRYYETFCQIRHRNKETYKKYQEDPMLYQSLLLQAEGYLYQLLKK